MENTNQKQNVTVNKENITSMSMKAYFSKFGLVFTNNKKDDKSNNERFFSVRVNNAVKGKESVLSPQGYAGFFLNIPINEKNSAILKNLTSKSVQELLSLPLNDKNNAQVDLSLQSQGIPFVLDNVYVKAYSFKNKENNREDVDVNWTAGKDTRIYNLSDITELNINSEKEITSDNVNYTLYASSTSDRRQEKDNQYHNQEYKINIPCSSNFGAYLKNYSQSPMELRKSFTVFLFSDRSNNHIFDKNTKTAIITNKDRLSVCHTSNSLLNKVEKIKNAFAKAHNIVLQKTSLSKNTTIEASEDKQNTNNIGEK